MQSFNYIRSKLYFTAEDTNGLGHCCALLWQDIVAMIVQETVHSRSQSLDTAYRCAVALKEKTLTHVRDPMVSSHGFSRVKELHAWRYLLGWSFHENSQELNLPRFQMKSHPINAQLRPHCRSSWEIMG